MRLSEGIGLRRAVAADMPLLHRVYCSTRQDELAAMNREQLRKDAFLQQQFELQHRYYHAHFPDAQFCIIQYEGQDIGRWYLDRAGPELRLIDIALLLMAPIRSDASGRVRLEAVFHYHTRSDGAGI